MAPGKGTTPKQVIIAPTDPLKNVEDKFRSAKFWGKKELRLLEVIFVENPQKRLDLNTVTNANGDELPTCKNVLSFQSLCD